MPFARIVVLVILAAGTAACSQTVSTTPPSAVLPPLPGHVATACHDPGVRAGEPVVSEFAKSRAALAKCRRAGQINETFYNDLRGK